MRARKTSPPRREASTPRTAPITSPATGSYQRAVIRVHAERRSTSRSASGSGGRSRSSRRDPSSGPLPLGRETVPQRRRRLPAELSSGSATYRPSCAAGRPARTGDRGPRAAGRRAPRTARSSRASSPPRRRRRCRCRCRLHRRDRRRDDVGDVREAARLDAVAEELERAALGEAHRDPRERHVGALPRAVGVEVPDHDDVEPEAPRVARARCSQASFVIPYGETGCAGTALRGRVGLGLAVDRRRRGEDDHARRPGRPPRRAAARRGRSARGTSRRRRRSCGRQAARRGGTPRRSRRGRSGRVRGRAAGSPGRARSPPSARRRSSP